MISVISLVLSFPVHESCCGNNRENPKNVKYKRKKKASRVQSTCAEFGQGPGHIKCAAG